MSNAFLRSQKIAIECSFLSKEVDTKFRKCTRGWTVEWFFLKPYCDEVIRLLVSRKLVSREQTIFSRILEKQLRREIGL